MANTGAVLWNLVKPILAGDAGGVSRLLAASPALARAAFEAGAARQNAKANFLDQIGRYIGEGDTALHIAAASYQTEIVQRLIAAGADVRARNRHGYESLHAAAAGVPGSGWWDPPAQAATIVTLIEAGADPNATDKRGVCPLHIAVRTRCAGAVRTLLECGSAPVRKNKNGSTAMLLAMHNTGRGGSGSVEAKSQREEIVGLLDRAGRGRGPRSSGSTQHGVRMGPCQG